MAGRPSPRAGDVLDDINEWMKRRTAAASQFLNDTEAAGRRAWNDATRAGQQVLARTQSEVRALGAQALRQASNP